MVFFDFMIYFYFILFILDLLKRVNKYYKTVTHFSAPIPGGKESKEKNKKKEKRKRRR